ncbi:MAG: crossover junction endodeoxyribonuclease RuvC [Acidobacteria bacterium]|nr:crossover junction endodeoxyribonuclease RuvC [Acidobacteriota bacterium]
MRVFGIDPGSGRTGYGCVDSDGSRHQLVTYGAIAAAAGASFPDKLLGIHRTLSQLITTHRPDCVVIENLFHAKNARSALLLGHARGVAVLAAVQAGLPVVEYTPTAVKLAIVGYGRAEKGQMQQMVKVLLGLDALPTPHDAADALAIAICHVNTSTSLSARATRVAGRATATTAGGTPLRSWRDYRPGMPLRRTAP